MKTILLGALLSLLLLPAGTGCSHPFLLRKPAYYEARRVPIVEIRPGAKAYFVRSQWYLHEHGRWTRYHGPVAVTQGREYIKIR